MRQEASLVAALKAFRIRLVLHGHRGSQRKSFLPPPLLKCKLMRRPSLGPLLSRKWMHWVPHPKAPFENLFINPQYVFCN